MLDASIIIPAYNEAASIAEVIRRVANVSKRYEIIVVDDGSGDATAEVAKKEGAIVIKISNNQGKGFACIAGGKKANTDKIIFIDADLQLNPEEIPKFVSALDECDLAIGTRDMKKIPLQRRLSNNLAKMLIQSPRGMKFSDALCGFRAVRKSKFLNMKFEKKRYEFESEMLLIAVENNMTIKEVPVEVSYESYKGMGIGDSLKVLMFILKKRLEK